MSTGIKSGDHEFIEIHGAKEHNLKNLHLKIPRNKITVITGLSGSGKSSLAFDTIYAEGQRRYVEGLSAYARQFLEQLKKPEVDSVVGLSPAIAIDQKSVGHNPRSTVGTITEIYDYLRLLYARVGTPLCPTHQIPLSSMSVEQMMKDILNPKNGSKFYIMAPMAQGKKGEFLNEFQKWFKKGFVKARVDGEIIELDKAKKLAKTKTHDIDLVIDQLILKSGIEPRLKNSLQTALQMSDGKLVIEWLSDKNLMVTERKTYSMKTSCPECGFAFPELEPRLFSFNNPRGACLSCKGLGTLDLIEVEESSNEKNHSSGDGGRVHGAVKYRYKDEKKSKDDDDEETELELSVCPDCQGTRLKKEALSVRIHNKNIAELSEISADELLDFFSKVKFSNKENLVAEKILKQINGRLNYLVRVGTGYLSLSRTARTLSGGEAQRIRLATQVGSSLIGVLYVMDEPSIGLHPRDHGRMLEILRELRDRGNTILLVEHDEETMMSADYLLDLGPRAGKLGGQIMAQGTPAQVMANGDSVTGGYLSGRLKIPVPVTRRRGNGKYLEVKKASGNNLKDVDMKIPLGTLTVVTGVSGSGKSTLVIDTLFKAVSQKLNLSSRRPSPYKEILGMDHVDRVIEINQHPIGRTPRSTPATYVGLFPMIRDLFANLPESKIRGYAPGRFSFNVKGGRCEACQGYGQVRLEMHFLADVFVTCDSCNGDRYNKETLNIKYNGKSIAEILKMNVEEALEFFKNHKLIHRKVETLHRVGLDYLSLGQSSTTLSGGEAQRCKLSRELSKKGTGQTIYILDEPTTGLHFEDIKKLIELLQELVDQGNTVLVIEHNLDVIKSADHLIDMGPEGGIGGGQLVASGTPESVSKIKSSRISNYLIKALAEK